MLIKDTTKLSGWQTTKNKQETKEKEIAQQNTKQQIPYIQTLKKAMHELSIQDTRKITERQRKAPW